jgi:PAS domain S-box-containing protein
MRIRTQFIITMVLFGVILAVVATSVIVTSRQAEQAAEQERIAADIAQGATELGYLCNDYLVYRESQQLKRWHSRFASFSGEVAGLNVDKPEQKALVSNILANEKRLKEVFDSVASDAGGPSQNQRSALDPTSFQVSWSRMAVQSQGLVSDASRLSQQLRAQADRLKHANMVVILAMMGLFGVYFLINYWMIQRRMLKSVSTLQAGAAVIGSGNLEFKIHEKKNDEIGDLSRAFNRMTDDLKAVTASKADLEKEIAERERAERELRRQREWLHVTLTSIGDAVIATDTSGRITFLNPVAQTLTGWLPADAEGKPVQSVFRIINEKTREPGEDIVSRVLEEGFIFSLANHTALITLDGREVPIEDSAAPIRDADGNVSGVVLVFHDVTEKRRAQQELARLASFPMLNPQPILEADMTGSVYYANPSAERVFANLGQLRSGHPWLVNWEAVADVFRGTDANLTGREIMVGDRWYFQTLHRVPETDRIRIYGLDITERKMAEEALQQSWDELEQRVKERTAELRNTNEELERRNRDLEDFVHVASHDLQEPLRKIQTFADLLATRHREAVGDKAFDYLKRMRKSAGRMQALVLDLLKYSRVTSKQEPFARFNLREVVEDAVTDLGVLYEETGGRIEVGDLPVIQADRVQMRQLFQNLIANGLKYRGEKKPVVRVYSNLCGDSFWEIHVRDNGIGFDECYLEKIFKPFQRLHGNDAPYEGTGMGLAICRRIVERHGGSVTARSEPGEGSTFIVKLPRNQ